MSLSNSVSFRHGSNVEFEGPAFVNTGGGKSGQDEVNWECTYDILSCLIQNIRNRLPPISIIIVFIVILD